MALELFYSYSHKDSALRDQLQTHLAQLARNGQIHAWHDRCIEPGGEWRDQIDEHIRTAQIVLLLISPDFLASDYCFDVEMKVALERHAKAQAIVVPIILRPVDWAGSPFAHLQALPQDAKAITLWADRDQAFADVARAIRDLAVRYQKPVAAPSPLAELADQQSARPRMLDAAMPSHIVKGRATELLVLIRLPESAGLAGVLQNDEEAEAKPEDVRSKSFDVAFPIGPAGQPQPLKVSVQLTAPDFAVPVERKNLFVPVNRDSEVCPFVLTPLRTGSLLVMIELVWEDAERGYRRLKTNCVAEAEDAGSPVMSVVQMPVRVQTSGMKTGAAMVGGIEAAFPASLVLGAEPEEFNYPPAPPEPPPLPAARNRPAPAAPAPYSPAPEPPTPSRSVPPPSKASFSSSPYVRAAAALCLLTLGGTFFALLRSPSTAPQSAPIAVGAGTPEAVQARAQVESAAVEFQQVSRRASRPPEHSPASAVEKPLSHRKWPRRLRRVSKTWLRRERPWQQDEQWKPKSTCNWCRRPADT